MAILPGTRSSGPSAHGIGGVREATDMARRIAAILLLEPALDANYIAVKEAYYHWPSLDGQS